MVHKDRLWLIDFQDARWGPITYDIVSLLWDPYAGLDDEARKKLLGRWKSALSSSVEENEDELSPIESAITGEGFLEELERMKVQRLLKAAGSYASFLFTKGRHDYLPSIAPALKDAVGALERLSELKLLRSEDAGLLTLLKGLKREDSALV
jgi:aminoglycoside/choline kinase family phosphotransferase